MIDKEKSENKLISVIMSFYNSEKFINESVKSILNQSYKNIEFIILNDGSKDNSQNIIDKFEDNRIKNLKNEINKGVPYSFNKLISSARGHYIAFMDADDISHEDRLKEQVMYMKNNNLDVCGTTAKTFGEGTNKIIRVLENYDEIKFLMIFGNPIINSSTMFRASVLKKFKCNENYISWDFDLYTNIINKGYKIQNLQKILLLSRQHINQDSKLNYFKGINDSYEISNKHLDQINILNNKKYIKKIKLGYKKSIEFKDYLRAIIFLNYTTNKKKYDHYTIELINTNLIQKVNLSLKNYFSFISINKKYKLKLKNKHKIFILFKTIFKVKYNGGLFKLLRYLNNLSSIR